MQKSLNNLLIIKGYPCDSGSEGRAFESHRGHMDIP